MGFMKTTDEAAEIVAPPNGTWAPVVEALERESLRSIRIRWRRGYGRGRYQSGRSIQVEDGDRVADVLAALVEAADAVTDDLGVPIDFQVDAHTTAGKRLGPWRVTLEEPIVADAQAASESAFRMFRQSEQVIARLLTIIQKQADAQAANMERIGQLLDPLVKVRAMELDHEEWKAEQEARDRADERMFDVLERLGAAYIRKRYGLDLDDLADAAEDVAADAPSVAMPGETQSTDDAEVMEPWETAAFMARNAMTEEVMSILRRAHLIKRWRAVVDATSEQALLDALDDLEAALTKRPDVAAKLAAHAPVVAAHEAAKRARAAAKAQGRRG